MEAERRLLRDLRVGFPRSAESNRILREAGARAHLAQVQNALDALRLDRPAHGVVGVISEAIQAGQSLAAEQVDAILASMLSRAPERLDELRAVMGAARIDFAAIEAQTRNAAARLQRHSVEAIERINTAVVDGLVRGHGYQKVAREVRDIITGPPGVRGGLVFHAESIARTELLSSLNDAREGRYREAGIDKCVWVATEDERTCEYCASRSGQLYALKDLVLPSHVRCRCTSAPFKDEWVADGLVDPEDYARHRADVREAFDAAHAEDGKSMATGPTPFERASGRPRPTPLEFP